MASATPRHVPPGFADRNSRVIGPNRSMAGKRFGLHREYRITVLAHPDADLLLDQMRALGMELLVRSEEAVRLPPGETARLTNAVARLYGRDAARRGAVSAAGERREWWTGRCRWQARTGLAQAGKGF
jgi:hypothetical protein